MTGVKYATKIGRKCQTTTPTSGRLQSGLLLFIGLQSQSLPDIRRFGFLAPRLFSGLAIVKCEPRYFFFSSPFSQLI